MFMVEHKTFSNEIESFTKPKLLHFLVRIQIKITESNKQYRVLVGTLKSVSESIAAKYIL